MEVDFENKGGRVFTTRLTSQEGYSLGLRHVEDMRVRESEEDGEGDDREHERVSASLEMQLARGEWRALLSCYCHDSYDGEYKLVLEDSQLFEENVQAAMRELGWSKSKREFLEELAMKTPYSEGYALAIRDRCQQ